jgi:glucose/arabinose dehydrogenase
LAALVLGLVFLPGGVAGKRASDVAVSAPAGFQPQTVVTGLNLPTSFAFAPDGRIFIAEKSGVVRVFKNGALLPTPLIDISAKVNNYWDRGLIGMALDPNFASNGYIYLLYPYEATATDDAGGKTARLSRYTVVGDTASPATETVLLGTNAGSACTQFPVGSDCIPAEWYGHGVGDIHFGSDGSMFLSNGDASSWNVVNDDALRAQDLNSLAGKIMRIDPNTGQGLPDNPYWSGDPNAARSKVWAYGVRNAYRFSVRPNSGTPGTVYAGDVGWDTTEEVDVVSKGANLGWPCYEGNAVQAGYQFKPVCQTLYTAVAADPSKWTKPIITWDHNGAGSAITGGAFNTGGAYPSAYQGAYFFGDYARNQLRYAGIDTSGVVTSGPADFDPAADSPVDIQVGPDGNLYYLAIASGQLIKYVYGAPPSGSGGFLSDLAWTSATNGWGPVEKDKSNGEQGANDGHPITLNGVAYPKGLGTHAAADVRYGISGCTNFSSDIGVDDEVGVNGSVVFQVYLDGTKAYDSGTMTGASATKSLSLDLTGKSELRLVVTNGGDNVDYDHADWANAQIACSGGGGGGGGGAQGSPPTFGPATSLPAGTAPHSVVATDVSGDGKFDLVAANALSNNVSVFKGNGDGTFQSGTTFSAGAAVKPKTAGVADLDADGKPDIVTANQDASTISVLKGTGGGGFAAPVQYPTCSRAHEAAIGDLNADGKPDAAVACWGGTVISVLLGNGDGTFRAAVAYGAGSQPHSIVIRDFNNDGKPDLAVANFASNNVSILRGVGDGTFQAAVNYAVGVNPHSLRAGDLNGDGKADIVTANAGSNTVTVLRGNGDGTFVAGQSYATGLVPKSVAIGDVNGNGLPDVVTANTAGNGDGVTGNPGGDRVSILLGDGTGALGSPTEFAVGQTPFSVYLADLNGDGKLDLSTAEWDSNTVTVRLNTTSGTGPTFSVSSVSPANGATGVAPATNVTATFSSDLDQSTLNSSTMTLAQGATTVPAALSYNAVTRTATIDPASDLQAGLTYTVTVVGGASGVKDTSGNTLASSKIWSFTVASGGGGGGGTTTFLSDLTWTSATNGWGPVEKDKSNGEQGANDGHPITLNTAVYGKGLGTHAASDVRYAISGCNSFQSDIGVDDEVGPNGSVVFQVYLDGTKAYDSGTMTGSTATKSVSLDLTGKSELRLVGTNAGDTSDYDHADWGNARITCGAGGGGTNQPPVPTITSPTSSTTFAVGDLITFQGSATDPEDGTLPASALTWQINIQHCVGASCHIHYFMTQAGAGGSFTVPDHGDMFHFDLTLTATDSSGASQSTTVTIMPRTVQLTLATNPTGLQVITGGTTGTAPSTSTQVQGATVTIAAPSPQGTATFSSWSDGGAQQHNVTLGTTDVTYTANFAVAQPLSVTSVTPANGATGVAVSSNSTATFSANLDPTTVNGSTMTLQQGTTAVPAAVTYNAVTRTATLDPTSNLLPGLVYTATVLGGASGVKDTLGNLLTSSKTWSFTTAAAGGGATTSYLSDLTWTSASNGWGPVEKDKSNGGFSGGDGLTITLNGTTYLKGLGTNANSDIRYSMAGKCTSFNSDIGVDDEVGTRGSVIFRVFLDGTKVYDSGTMTGSTSTKSISVNTTGKNQLRLYVDLSTNGNSHDHADWANARITCNP